METLPIFMISLPIPFGESFISQEEMDKGVTVRVYAMKGHRNRFLVIKVSRDGNNILESRVERS